MTINLVVGQSGGASGASGGAISKAFTGNVTSGNLILVLGWRYNDTTSTDFTAGNCTKSAGTATIGAIAKDVSLAYLYSSPFYIGAAIWSCQVTGTGSCTMNIAVGAGSSQTDIAIAEFHSDSGAITFLSGTNKTGTGASGAPATASATSTGNSIFAGCVGTGTGGATTHTVGAGFTQIYEEENGATLMTGSSEYKIVTATSSTASWTAPTTAQWVAALAVYQEPVSGSSPRHIQVANQSIMRASLF